MDRRWRARESGEGHDWYCWSYFHAPSSTSAWFQLMRIQINGDRSTSMMLCQFPSHSSCITIYSAGGQSFMLTPTLRKDIGECWYQISINGNWKWMYFTSLHFNPRQVERESYLLTSVCPYDFSFDISTSIPRYSRDKRPANYGR